MVTGAAAAVLAGGDGTRMGGVSKAFLEVEGRPIIARQLELLRALFAEVFVVANDPAPFAGLGIHVVADLLPGRGAPGGVHAAVASARAPWVFCLACDMPFASAAPIELLAARRGTARAVAPLVGDRPEPLFSFYSKRCVELFARLLAEGSPSLIRLLLAVEPELVLEAEFARADPTGRALENLNTPRDLARAQAGR